VAKFETFVSDFWLVTQNVDGLHDRAGNKRILKLHGDIWEVRCVSCGLRRMDYQAVLPSLPPLCECGGLLRPGVVWFGEVLPADIFEQAVGATQSSDLFFSVGTSAQVFPASQLPGIARQHGAYVVEVNIEPSAAAGEAHEVLLGKAGRFCRLLRQVCKPRWRAERRIVACSVIPAKQGIQRHHATNLDSRSAGMTSSLSLSRCVVSGRVSNWTQVYEHLTFECFPALAVT
jgi:hypothetical protein